MATIKYLLQSDKNPATIYLRLSLNRSSIFKKKIPLSVNPMRWSTTKSELIAKSPEEKNLNSTLRELSNFIISNLNISQKEGVIINSLWLDTEINIFFNKENLNTEIDYSILNNYLDYFVECKTKDFQLQKIEKGTLTKYKTISSILKEFQIKTKKSYRLTEINKDFITKIETYCKDVLNYNINTQGRFIKFIKTIVLHARDDKNLKISNDVSKIKGYTAKVENINLNFDELEKIENTIFENDYLDNARDWLIIGCYTGQRVSDLLRFTKHSIKNINGTDLIQITQQKTQKLVSIPLHQKVKELLKKRNGNFPRAITDQKFNLYIKKVCEIAGINEPKNGLLFNPETKTKEVGTYEKYKLVTSHICRRSFATNFYGKIPTSLLIGITAHSTEAQFLDYVGKPQDDKALQLAEIWEKEAIRQKENLILKVV